MAHISSLRIAQLTPDAASSTGVRGRLMLLGVGSVIVGLATIGTLIRILAQ